MPIQGLILNADDFGRNSKINQAIVRSFEQNLCSSTTIMVNMPGFEEAVELAKQNGFADRVGIHLNLYDGEPLTDEIKLCRRICRSEGFFLEDKRERLITLSSEERYALEKEIYAQVNTCLVKKLAPIHLDSHCHVHNEWGVIKILNNMAKRFGIKYIRLCRNKDINSKWWKNCYRSFVNFQIRTAGLAGTDFFGTIEDALRLHKQIIKPFVMEAMLHPTLNKDDQIIDFFLEGSLKSSIDKLLQTVSLESTVLCSFNDILLLNNQTSLDISS